MIDERLSSLADVVDRRGVGSWLDGPRLPAGASPTFPGQRIGRPERGPGSVAGVGRRLLGVFVDWGVSLLIAHAVLGTAAAALAVFAVEQALLVGTLGTALGHRIAGLRVERLDGGAPGLARSVLRTVLLCLAVPALIWDADQRGLHDKAAGTLVVRS
jgi:uncharacterized RDD family membrane protein YckC